MFQLIVAIVAIALVLLLVVAAMYFGGSIYDESGARAAYAKNVNSATQIEAAMQLYYHDEAVNAPGVDMVLLQNLHEWGYLKEIPEGDWKVNATALYKPIKIQDVEQCSAMNKAAGFNVSQVPDQYEGCPPCNGAEGSQQLADAEAFKKWPGCQFISTVTAP
ncbi:hypothetical protein GOB57_08500 [Sinorhizobium meliloti]|nr:hypothetical protein [Sinorhizobium meliloti]